MQGLCFSPDGCTLAAGLSDGPVILWDVATGRERVRYDWGLRPLWCLAFAPDGLPLAAGPAGGRGERRGRVVLWDVDG